jgi:hypothetical protein
MNFSTWAAAARFWILQLVKYGIDLVKPEVGSS